MQRPTARRDDMVVSRIVFGEHWNRKGIYVTVVETFRYREL